MSNKDQARFSQLPRAAVMDDTLTPIDFKVLAVIGLYLNDSHEAWPMQETIAKICGKSASTVSRAIKRLEKAGYVASRKKFPKRPGTHKCYCVVFKNPDGSETIKNDSSQQPQQDHGTVKNSGSVKNDCPVNAPMDASPIGTNPVSTSLRSVDMVREDAPPPKERKPSPRGKARGSRIPDGWAPSPNDYAFAAKQGLTQQEINHEADQFRDHWLAATKNAVKRDWSAAWRTWTRNSAKWKSERTPSAANGRSTGGLEDTFARAANKLAGYPAGPAPAPYDDGTTIEGEFAYAAPDASAGNAGAGGGNNQASLSYLHSAGQKGGR